MRTEPTATAVPPRPVSPRAVSPRPGPPPGRARVTDLAALDAAVRQVGDRWSLQVVGALLGGEATFGELRESVSGIASNILTARLRALQQQGLISAEPYEHRPVRMRYAMTETGRALGAAILALAAWGAEREGLRPVHVHELCGSRTELRPYCPTCAEMVGGDDDLIWC